MKKIISCILIFLVFAALVSCEGENEMPTFTMKARVDNIGDRIEVTVIEAEYAEGIYWLVVGESTEFTDKNGDKITQSELSVGDVIEITYNGQVMMSYPPQIAALKIKKTT